MSEKHQHLHNRVRRGATWGAIDVGLTRTGNFVLGLVVARLLVPRDFGVYAIAIAVHSIVIGINDLGLATALVRGDEETAKKGAPTVATMTLVSSTCLGAMMALLAPEFARWLGDSHATSTIRVMALSLPLAGLSAVPFAMLRRDFRMDIQFLADVSNLLVTAMVVTTLAVAGFGPLALAWGYLAGQVMTTLVLIFSPGAWSWPGWDRKYSWRLLRFGLPLTGANMVNYATQNVDYVVVGAVAGAVPLGYYMLAFNISGWPQNLIAWVVRTVSVSGFSRLREMGGDMTKALNSALGGVAKVALPVCLFLGAMAHPLVQTAYGSKWEPAAAALVTLSLMGLARVLSSLLTDFLVSLGHATSVFIVQLIWLPALILALLFGVHHDGIAGAGIAQASISWLIVMPTFIYVVARSGVPARSLLRTLGPPGVWALASAAVAWQVSQQISTPALAVLAGGAAGLSMYVIPFLGDIRRLVSAYRARRRSRSAPVAANVDVDVPLVDAA